MSTNLNGLNQRIERIEQVIEALAPAPDDKPVVYIPDNSRDCALSGTLASIEPYLCHKLSVNCSAL